MRSCRPRKALSILALLAVSMTNGLGAAPATRSNGPVAAPSMRPALTPSRAVGKRVFARRALVAPSASLVGDGFSGSSTTPNSWLALGNACLTAGTSATPATSIPACGANAPQDPNGQGALELTSGTAYQSGMVVARTPVSTSTGLQVTFTDYSFNGSTPGADGITFFLSDASQAMPTAIGALGGSLGYANGQNGSAAGIANGYVGIAFDEYGNFSNPSEGRTGGPGPVPETIAIRGAAPSGYQYIGGATNAAGQAATLPCTFDQPAAATRPANAPTIQMTLTPAGLLTVLIDRHDGNGFVQYYSQTIVGVNGQPAVPASVYVGLTASTGGDFNRHQIGSFSVAALSAAPQGFAPTQIPNLKAWFDASSPAGVTQSAGAVSAWNDLSGNSNTVSQATAALRPAFAAAGINNLGTLNFSGNPYLVGSNASFSSNLFNESTVFVVSNQGNSTQSSSVAWAGAYYSNPRWNLRLSEAGVTNFDFDNNGAGRLSPKDVPNGPAIWTAAGSVGAKAEYVRKDGNTLSSSTGPGAPASGSYPLVIGAMAKPGQASYKYNGQLGEVLMFNRYLSAAETTQVEGYLACKWGLQNRLPANHPYRNLCPQGGTHPSLPVPPPAANALLDPPQVRSANGQLVFNVVAAPNATNGSPQLTYNGSSVPPTLRLLPGDTLIVNLTNNLPTPPAGAGYLNDTNLHYHGLHVTPNAPGDDSIDMLAMPGQTLHYQIAIPANHPTGLYWYHSHAHGEAERQNLSAMSGALIIDGVSQYVPQVTSMPERVLIARDVLLAGQVLPAADKNQVRAMFWAMQHGSRAAKPAAMSGMTMPGGMSMHGMAMDVPVRGNTTAKTRNPFVVVDAKYRRFVRPAASTHCLAGETASKNWTLNGQSQPSIGIRPGEQQFWRLVNAGSDTYLDVQVDNTQMQIVGIDGVPLASVGNTPMTVSHYVVPPASRIEFIVTGPPAGKSAFLRTNCFDSGQAGPAMPAATLATINAASSLSDNARLRDRIALRTALHPARVHGIAFMRNFVRNAGIARTQTLTYSDQNTINGQAYDPSGAAQFYAQSGTMEQWQIVNNSSQVHTFHIHQLHFLVQSIVGGTPIEQNNVGQVIDNVNVPAATANGPGSVRLLMDFTDPSIIGTFLLHCHILSHEDAGMMAKIRVGTAPPMTTNAPPQGLNFASAAAPAQTVTVRGGLAPYSVSGCANVANASINGASVSVAPAGAGSCVLTISDASGLSVTVAISVQGVVSPISLTPNVLAFSSPAAPAQTATIAGGTPPYGVSGCANVASASISGSALSVAPLGLGSCTLTVADSASNTQTLAVSVNARSSGSPADNVTFHQNNSRQGWYEAESTLTTASVASSNFGLLGSLAAPSGMPAFGKVYAQPLYATSENIGGAAHNLVIVSTTTDQVYAFDDVTGAVVWERSFTNPGAGITQQSWSDTGCSDVNPDIGITGTPVIDRRADRMYVVVPTKESGTFHQRLHAISLQNGNDAVTPVEVSATVALASGGTASIDPKWNFNRSALLEANGNIYVAFGSHCDYNTQATHGWVVAYSAGTLQPAGNAVDMTNSNNGGNYFLGSPWMSGYGPAADAQGNVYFATGNGPWDGTSNFSMSVLKLPGNLDISGGSYFTPASEASDSNGDQDLGSGGVMLLPDGISSGFPHLLVQAGKGGASGAQKYLLNRDRLGGMQPGDNGAVWHQNSGGSIWGGPAFFQDTSGNSYVIYGNGAPLNAYQFNPSSSSFSVYSSANVGCLECRDSGSQPVVSSNGTNAGTAVAWALRTPGNSGGTISLFAFDALKMTTLFTGAAGTWNQAPGTSWIGGALVSPLVANGRVYVPTDGAVAIFGLRGTGHSMLRLRR